MRTINGLETLEFKYTYNDKNQLHMVQYPGRVFVEHDYDNYGNETTTVANGNVFYRLKDFDGLDTKTSFFGSTVIHTRDGKGYETNIRMANDSTLLENFNVSYDTATGNLLSRQRNSGIKENFSYDDLLFSSLFQRKSITC